MKEATYIKPIYSIKYDNILLIMPYLHDDFVLQAFAANGYVPTLTFTPIHPQTALLNSHHR